MTDQEKRIREEIAATVEGILDNGGTTALLQYIRADMELDQLAAKLLVQIRDWEADSDELLTWIFERMGLPWWVPEGWIRGKVDDALPDLVLNPVLAQLLDVPPERAQDVSLYEIMKP